MYNNHKVIKAIPVLVVAVIAIAYFWGWDIGVMLHPDQTADGMVELTTIVNDQIEAGDESGVFYVSNITENDINSINDYICGLYGNVHQYSIIQKTKKGMKIILRYEISDNYYVYQKYINGTGIPGDRPAAVKLYDKVDSVLNRIIKPGMTDYEKELAIHDYIVANCSYGYVDYSKEYAYRAYGALVQGTAVCNGYAEAMALLLSCSGVENEFMTGTADGELHAWNRVCLDGKWYQVDATWDDPLPDRGSFVGHMYFNVTDDIMDDRHVWDEESFEACDSMTYNYFAKNNLICDYESFKNEVKRTAGKNITGTVEIAVTDYSDELYDMQFLQNVSGVMYCQYSNEQYGDDMQVVTVYLNQMD